MTPRSPDRPSPALLPDAGTLWRIGLLALAGAAAILIETAPVGTAPRALPAPSLLFLAVGVVAVRRPEAVPVPVVLVLGLARDLIGDGPPGAGALALVLGTEVLRRLGPRLARGPLAREWAGVAAVALAAFALKYLLVLAVLAQPPYVMAVVRQWAITVAFWPLVFLALRWGLGFRAPRPRGGLGHGA